MWGLCSVCGCGKAEESIKVDASPAIAKSKPDALAKGEGPDSAQPDRANEEEPANPNPSAKGKTRLSVVGAGSANGDISAQVAAQAAAEAEEEPLQRQETGEPETPMTATASIDPTTGKKKLKGRKKVARSHREHRRFR